MERNKERQDGTSATEMLDQRKVGSVYRGRDLISKHYKLGPELGRGAFAVVRCASSRANKRWWQSESLKGRPSKERPEPDVSNPHPGAMLSSSSARSRACSTW